MSKRSSQLSSKNNSSTKVHSKWSDTIYGLDDYFRKIIKSDENDATRFVCLVCSNKKEDNVGGFRESLRDHLITKTHKKKTQDEDKLKLEEVIRKLDKNAANLP